MLTACQQVMPYSTGCCTPLSNFEAGLNYKDVSDPAVMVRWQLMRRCIAVEQGKTFVCSATKKTSSCLITAKLTLSHCFAVPASSTHYTTCLISSRLEQVAFVLLDDPDNAEMIAWTTTPWRAHSAINCSDTKSSHLVTQAFLLSRKELSEKSRRARSSRLPELTTDSCSNAVSLTRVRPPAQLRPSSDAVDVQDAAEQPGAVREPGL